MNYLALGDSISIDDYTGVVYDTDEGRRIGEALGNKKAAILRNHGLMTVGQTVDEAAWWFITMERSCQAQLMAEAAGKPISIDAASAKHTHGQVGTPLVGWFAFQPLWDKIGRDRLFEVTGQKLEQFVAKK